MREAPPTVRTPPRARPDGVLIFACLLSAAFAAIAIVVYVDEFKVKQELEQVRTEARAQAAASIAKQGDLVSKAAEVELKAKNAERSVAAIAQKVGELSEALEQSQAELKSTKDDLKHVRTLNADSETKIADLTRALAKALAEAEAERNRPAAMRPSPNVVDEPRDKKSALARALESSGASLVWKASHWELIKYGQSPGEVRAFAGPPVSEQSREGGTYWYYIEEGVGMIFIRFKDGVVAGFGRGTR
jgi:hypothetical protein